MESKFCPAQLPCAALLYPNLFPSGLFSRNAALLGYVRVPTPAIYLFMTFVGECLGPGGWVDLVLGFPKGLDNDGKPTLSLGRLPMFRLNISY